MRIGLMSILLVSTVGGCSLFAEPRSYSVYFEPYSSALDNQARATVHAAADAAKAHRLRLIEVTGYSAPPDPKRDVDGLSEQRALAVKQALVDDGVWAQRITTTGAGVTDPKNLPQVAVRRVDITIGHVDAPEGAIK